MHKPIDPLTSRIELRPVNPGDEADAVDYVKKYYHEDGLKFDVSVELAVCELISHPEWGSFYRIVFDEQVVGYIGFTYGFDHEVGGRFGTITDFYIDAEHRGRGIGATALRNLIEIAVAGGLKEIGLVVLDHNERVRGLYEREGFMPESGRAWMWRRTGQPHG